VPPGVAAAALITLQSHANPDDFVTIPVSLEKGNVFDYTGSIDTDGDEITDASD
jgi:hypothetical protein